MTPNILITGAAGYIGGSLVASLVSENAHLPAKNIFAAVRTDEQVQSLQPLGINVLQLDLKDEESVAEAVLKHEIDIVVHTASSIDFRLALNLIKALGKRREVTGKDTYHIHSSVTTGYSKECGWPYGTVKDGDAVYKLEKELNDGFPIRTTNIAITELAGAQGVTNFIVGVPFVYGTGAGQWKKLSQNIPASIKAGAALKTVYKFDSDSNFAAVHVSDLAEYYVLLLKKLLQGEKLPSGEKGYYFAVAHEVGWWDIAQGLANTLHARGLVTEPTAKVWPSDEMAAEVLDLPRQYVRVMHTARATIDYQNRYPLGWQPTWDKERLLASMDEEVDATFKHDKGKTSLFDALN
ncbi:putative NAD dependent epimerase dehydratase family protein [Rosellinia necatrix]|uniref:Putative NAD dependent epimerase dehydratase family protein n=1 Tax=Rosellinia necatrix TaxID=77044 RepID=A0A1W2TDD1_ROSNE|nr:putative NAD dependent epimerase dehydratase family protein [Rosellinia necatrix]